MSYTIPGGREKGTPIEDASDQTLTYWAQNCRDQELRDACASELERRGISAESVAAPPPAQQRQQPPSSAATGAIQVVGESISTGGALMEALQRLDKTCLLVTPTTATNELPEGCAVAISMVRVDPRVDGYPLTGNKEHPKPDDHIGLGKTAIERISAAAGASWLPGLTGRIDDGRNPHYCHYSAWARYQDLDGSFRDYPGECEIDLRDGSPQTLDIIRKAKKNNRDSDNQLAEARKFIQRQCASKAMLVAMRRPGLRHWYTREELMTKPFAVAKLIFHGRTKDPALKELFGKLIAERFSTASRQLFGAVPVQPKHSAPPVGSVPIETEGHPLGDDEFPSDY